SSSRDFNFRRNSGNTFGERSEPGSTRSSACEIKPQHRPGSFKFYYDLLFDYPFGGVEIQNMRTMMDLNREEYGLTPIISPEELVEWLQQFHTRLAARLHHGQAVLDLVPD